MTSLCLKDLQASAQMAIAPAISFCTSYASEPRCVGTGLDLSAAAQLVAQFFF